MTDHCPAVYRHQPESPCIGLLRWGTLGAVVGGSAAAADSMRRVNAGEIDSRQAVAQTGRTAAATGVATAFAGTLAASVSDQPAVRLGVMFAAGAAALYAINRWTEKEAGAAEPAGANRKPTRKKSPGPAGSASGSRKESPR